MMPPVFAGSRKIDVGGTERNRRLQGLRAFVAPDGPITRLRFGPTRRIARCRSSDQDAGAAFRTSTRRAGRRRRPRASGVSVQQVLVKCSSRIHARG